MTKHLCLGVLVGGILGCDGGSIADVQITIPPQAEPARTALLSKPWSFSFEGPPTGTSITSPNRRAPRNPQFGGCALGAVVPVVPPSNMLQVASQRGLGMVDTYAEMATVVAIPDGTYRYYALATNQKGALLAEFDVWSGMAFSDPLKREAWSAGRKIVDIDTLSLAAAPTPGGHHVRLYLETDGKITTMISVKDDFETFREGEPLNFVSLNGENLSGISPRSPNVSVSEDGVYAMTWDNFGSGRGEAGKVASPNFGLAFSVDGITWTVYSNALTVVGVTGFVRPGTGGDCPWSATGDLRQVIPVFVRGDQIRLYFNYPYMFAGSTSLCRNPTYNFGPDCVSGTAISN